MVVSNYASYSNLQFQFFKFFFVINNLGQFRQVEINLADSLDILDSLEIHICIYLLSGSQWDRQRLRHLFATIQAVLLVRWFFSLDAFPENKSGRAGPPGYVSATSRTPCTQNSKIGRWRVSAVMFAIHWWRLHLNLQSALPTNSNYRCYKNVCCCCYKYVLYILRINVNLNKLKSFT